MSVFTIGIIGGTGVMGQWFKTHYQAGGHRVLISGRKTDLTYEELTRRSDVVMLSLPLLPAIEICRRIGPLMSEAQLLTDVCSLKEPILEAMLQYTSAQVTGTHPLFGPFTGSLNKQNVIVCPGRGRQWQDWLETDYRNHGAVVTRLDPAIHDRNMAVVQGITHIISISLARMMQKMELTPEQAFLCATPVFRVKMDLIGRMFAQDLEMYANLMNKNAHTHRAAAAFQDAMREVLGHVVDDNEKDPVAFMQEIKAFLGNFCQKGLDESIVFLDSIYGKSHPHLNDKQRNSS